MSMTKQEQMANQLLELGFTEKSNSRKYRKFTHEKLNRNLFIGRHGALRWGRTQSESISVNPQKVLSSLQSKYYKGEL